MVNRLYNKQVSPKGYFLGGRVKKKEKPRDKRKPIDPKTKQDSLREKLVPKKKMDRLKQLREELK